MPRFFFDASSLCGDTVTLTGESASHILLSLRMAVGDSLELCDGEGHDYPGTIVSASREAVTVSVSAPVPSCSEPPYAVRLYQCVPKGDKFETVIQKSVECGVTEIIPVQSSRCIAKIKREDAQKKLTRYQRIAEEAAKQSGRGRIPQVREPVSFSEALTMMKRDDFSFLCYENEDGKTVADRLRQGDMPKSVSFLIGPEGGLSPEEVEKAASEGIVSVSLGNRILRTETASTFVLAILAAFYEL